MHKRLVPSPPQNHRRRLSCDPPTFLSAALGPGGSRRLSMLLLSSGPQLCGRKRRSMKTVTPSSNQEASGRSGGSGDECGEETSTCRQERSG